MNERRQGPLGVILEAAKHRMWGAFLPSPTTRKENPSMLDQRAFSHVFCYFACTERKCHLLGLLSLRTTPGTS